MKRAWVALSLLGSVLALAAGACGPSAAGLDLTAEPAIAEPPQPVATPDTYQSVEIPDAGIAFEVPGNWHQDGQMWMWSPNGGENPRVGVSWIDLQPPMEPEAALLPRPSQILGSQPVELSWASGRSFTVAVYGPAPEGADAQAPVQSVETHIVVVAAGHGERRAYDFYAAGSTVKELDTLQPILDQMLTSATPLEGSLGATSQK
jgi:hypothetical protein